MLIETPYKENDVITLKVTSGEEIVAKLEKEDEITLKLSKPFALVPSQSGLGMMPWFISVHPDTKITVNKTTVMGIAKTEDGIASQYFQQTTGLSLV